jgi:hypothetical protein
MDNTFDGDGKKTIDAGGNDVVNSIIVQSDGKILGGGSVNPNVSSSKMLILKMNPDGSADNNFDGDGMGLYSPLPNNPFQGEDMALQGDGKIVVVGYGWDQVIIPPGQDPSGRLFARLTNNVAAAGPLPTSLKYFDVTVQNSTSVLEWVSAFEQNSDRFDILHSVNGRDFKTIGEIKASGNSSADVKYHYTHNTPVSGWNYYRLLMKDLDGKSTLSEIRSVNFNQHVLIEVSPNPAGDFVRVKYQFPGVKEVTVVDMYGRIVATEKTNNSSDITINIRSLHAGIYAISIQHTSGKVVARFVKN